MNLSGGTKMSKKCAEFGTFGAVYAFAYIFRASRHRKSRGELLLQQPATAFPSEFDSGGIHSDSRMSESIGIDSPIEVVGMPKSYSVDLRQRVVESVASGASRHEAADLFGIAVSTAVKWCRRWHDTGSVAPNPRGGSTSPLDEHATLILELVKEQPDATFMELLAMLRKRRIHTSRSALWRFFERHDITFKKKPAGGGTAARGRGPGTTALDTRAGAA
jgi:transposase